MIKGNLTINDAAAMSGASADTLRRLEREGLIPAPARDALTGYRVYDQAAIEALRAALAELGYRAPVTAR